MIGYEMRRSWRAIVSILVVAGTLTTMPALAGTSEPVGGWPWARRPKTYGYDENPAPSPPPAHVTQSPARYTITITVNPPMAAAPKEKSDMASVMAYVPANAMLWFDGTPTKQTGILREFESPPLKGGKKYTYEVRVVWFEDGHWVHQSKDVPISAGEMTCLYLTKPSAVTAALAQLSAEDRKLAEQQRFCVVQQETPLGTMGKPIKVTIRGQPVFLCCADCEEKARENPDKTLAILKELKSKGARTPPK